MSRRKTQRSKPSNRREICLRAFSGFALVLWISLIIASILIMRWSNLSNTAISGWISWGSLIFTFLGFPILFMISLTFLDRRLPEQPSTAFGLHNIELQNSLARLSSAQRIGFSAACLERLSPVCYKACEQYGYAVDLRPSECLDAIWEFLISGTPPRTDLLQRAHKTLDGYDSDEDVEQREWSSVIEEYCTVISIDAQEALLALDDAHRIERCGAHMTAFNLIDCFIDSMSGSEPSFDEHHLTSLEISRQQSDIRDLLKDTSPTAISRIRNRSRTQPLLGACWFPAENW